MLPLSDRLIVPGKTCCASIILPAILLIISFTTTYAQGGGGNDSIGTGGRHVIRGRIFFPSGRAADLRAKVKLESTNSSAAYVLADPGGGFRFSNLEPGVYTLTVEAGEEYETVTESVYIEGSLSLGGGAPTAGPMRIVQVPIYLRLKQLGRGDAKSGVVNASQAGIPATAYELFDKALWSARAGDSKKAIEQLKAVVSTYPSFAAALNELGVQYLKLGQPDKAAEVLQSAVKFTPDQLMPHLNYGIALLNQKKYSEAEVELRQALKKNNVAPTAHMYLGIAQMSQHNLDDAEKELELAIGSNSNEVGIAHRYLAGILWGKREYRRAADELETYLRLFPKASDAERTKAAIKELRSKQQLK
jgi:tetratricopeptide (TPR) repeat protein